LRLKRWLYFGFTSAVFCFLWFSNCKPRTALNLFFGKKNLQNDAV
jgi:hypothetical protein